MPADRDFQERLSGARLTTAEVLYHMPDHPGLLQSFVRQKLDRAPEFPVLNRFLAFWDEEIDAEIHSVRVGQAGLVSPVDIRKLDSEFRLN